MAEPPPGTAPTEGLPADPELPPPSRPPGWRPRPGARAYRWIANSVRRRPGTCALLLALLHVTLALITFEPRPHTGGDNGAYITLAQSLLERGTYTELWDPAEPPHTKYPPVFPAVLAVAMALGLAPWVPLKLVVLGFSATAVAFAFLWLRARRRAALAVGIGLLLAVAPGVLREGRWILSDVPFWAFTMIALWAFERLRPDDRPRYIIGAAAILLAYFTRSAGLPLALAALAWLFLQRRWRRGVALGVTIGLPALVWWLRGRAPGQSAYVSEFWLVNPYVPQLGTIGAGDLLARVYENVLSYATTHLPVLLSGGTGTAAVAASVLILGFAFAGWIARLRRPRVSDLFVLLYLGLILVWPAVWSGERFLLPLLPLLLALAAEAVIALVGTFAPRQDLRAVAAAGVLLAAFALPGLVSATRTGLECTGRYLDGERYPCMNVYHLDFFEFAEEIGVALPADAVVLNRKPRLFYPLSGGMKSAIYPLNDDPAVFFAAAREAGARYVLYDELDAVSESYLQPVIAFHPHAFCLMWGSERTGTMLFGILPGADAATGLTLDDVHPDYVSVVLCGDEYWRSPGERTLRQPG